MNDYGNNIILGSQNGCDLVLTIEEGGDFPKGSKVFYYKDLNGVDKSVDLTNLSDGYNLFRHNPYLNIDWDISLPNLTNGTYMFSDNMYLRSFSGDLPNLNYCGSMFMTCISLTSFSSNISNITNGSKMFSYSSLKEFTAELPNLDDGTLMFGNCEHLKSFSVDLPNLRKGDNMFTGCKLDKASVHRIAESIPSKPDGATSGYSLTLGIDASLQNDAEVAADLATIETTKKWTLTTEWN